MNKKKLRIGMLGFTTANENLGCVALTYSMITMLEKIRVKNQWTFEYWIFEAGYNREKVDSLCELCNVERSMIQVWTMTAKGIFLKTLAHINVYFQLARCDLVIDITAGDSFADIYGNHIFDYFTKFKKYVIKRQIPLVLAPQTYGPFENQDRLQIAADIVNKSSLALARDQESSDYMKKVTQKDIYVTTDIAFRLPYKQYNNSEHNGKIKIGINISDLLYEGGSETTFNRNVLKTDYTSYIDALLQALLEKSDLYDIYLISHVGGDYSIACRVSEKIAGCKVVSKFDNPVAAKNFISGMNIFIGSRMHATIAAFSSGVATIPVAYSKKFEGLFGSLEYPYIIDMRFVETEVAVMKTLKWVEEKDILRESAEKSRELAEKYCLKTESMIEHFIRTDL